MAFEVTGAGFDNSTPLVDVFIMDHMDKVLFSYLKKERGLIKVPIVNSKEHKVVFSNFKVKSFSITSIPLGLSIAQIRVFGF